MTGLHQDTLVTLLGREENFGFASVSAPVFRTSTVLFPDYEAFERAMYGRYDGITYGRYGTPTTRTLEQAVAALEGADGAAATCSGMAAVAAALTAFLQTGDHLLMVDSVYDPARHFCDEQLRRYGIEVTYYDPLVGVGIEGLIRENTRVIYLESPGSLTFEMQDIGAITAVAQRHGIVTVMDNTWATPLYCTPLAQGVDVSLHSATKYIGGHSDLLMGFICFKQPHEAAIRRSLKHYGICTNGEEAFLAARGLRSMAVRLRHHERSALKLAEWLRGQPQVAGVLHPALPDDPGHALWKRQTRGSSGLFSFRLAGKPGRDSVARMADGMRLFKLGFSWGGFESLMVPFYPARVRSIAAWEKEEIVIRLHVGLEDVDDLIADLEAGLKRLAG